MLKKLLFVVIFLISSVGFSQNAHAVCTDYIYADPDSETVSKFADSFTSGLVSNTSWTASSPVSWLTVTPSVNSYTVSYSANTGSSPRTATITFSTSCATDTYTLTQLGNYTYLDSNPSTLQFSSSSAQYYFVSVISNASWTATSSSSWLTFLDPSTSSSGATTVSGLPTMPSANGVPGLLIFLTNNSTGVDRSATITLTSGALTKNINILQACNGFLLCSESITVSPSSETVGSSSGSATPTVAVTANRSWIARSNDSWITLNPPPPTSNPWYTFPGGTTSFTVDYASNTSSSPRTGTVTLQVPYTGKSTTYTINQNGVTTTCADFMSVSPQSDNVTSSTGTITPIVTSNKSWTATSSDKWVKINPGVFYFDVDYEANTSLFSRNATVTLTQFGCATPVIYSLTQAGKNVIFPPQCTIKSFTASPSCSASSSTATLSWDTADCKSASINGGSFSKSPVSLPKGSQTDSISSTTKYTLSADDGTNFESKDITVTIGSCGSIKPKYSPF
jgi:hypothetical protein